ncbi:MAG: ATP-dependent zinc protease [Chitinophagales bacterium]|nr:ATP-dependent zinc protease [Chitinophagales bacterium]
MKKDFRHIIGRTDKVDFPELDLYNIEAKIDSGAYTSSIHCENVMAFYSQNDHYVSFTIYDKEMPITKEGKVFASKQVKNSFGQIEYRYSINTVINLFGENYIIELALTNRSSMKFPVLLGRKLLRDHFIVDVTRQNLSYREKIKKQVNAEKPYKPGTKKDRLQ